MHKLFARFKDLDGRHPAPVNYPELPPAFRAEQDFFRYRKQRGVNLGSWFVLERWISDGPFQSAASPAQSDHDVARGKDAQTILEKHWNEWVTEEDWAWLRERGFTSVRIPIGYYHLVALDPSLLDGTDFHGLQHVFSNAWAKITQALEMAYKYRIGVLLDLHAAPGKQNADAHSGTSNSPTFFSSSTNRKHATHILQTLLAHLNELNSRLPNIIGIQLLNEPHPPSDDILQSWYKTTIRQLHSTNPDIPIYLGECWRTKEYANWLVSSCPNSSSLTVLDHHLYRCFTGSDIHTSADVHIDNLNSSTRPHLSHLDELLGRVPGGSGIIIGEWSGALNPGSLTSSTTGGHDETRRYIEAQLSLYDATCAGWFFWTFKKQNPGDFGWSLRDAVGAGTFPNHVGLRLHTREIDLSVVESAKIEAKGVATGNHCNWWSQFPGKYEHWRFETGFCLGWDEALRFIMFDLDTNTSVTELGFTRAWAKKIGEREQQTQSSSYWEFEHGFLQGVNGVRDFVKGIYGSS